MVVVVRKEIKDLSNASKKRLCSSGLEWRNYLKVSIRQV